MFDVFFFVVQQRQVPPRFEIKKWNAVAMWSWDICADTCAICRNSLNEPSIEYQVLPVTLLYAVVVPRDTVGAVVRTVARFASFEEPEMVDDTEKCMASISRGLLKSLGEPALLSFFSPRLVPFLTTVV